MVWLGFCLFGVWRGEGFVCLACGVVRGFVCLVCGVVRGFVCLVCGVVWVLLRVAWLGFCLFGVGRG